MSSYEVYLYQEDTDKYLSRSMSNEEPCHFLSFKQQPCISPLVNSIVQINLLIPFQARDAKLT